MPDQAAEVDVRRAQARSRGIKFISLALQGGGAHGAFTWGVLDRLITDRRVYIDGISGTSAGAMNAVVFAYHFRKGGRQAAVAGLERFWRRVSDDAMLRRPPSFGMDETRWSVDSTLQFQMFDFITRIFSPYQLNPFDLNPLRDILAQEIDFAELREYPELKLFVCAANVRTCKPRVFTTKELTVETLMASACLPLLFRAVEIDGEAYWDGGYLGNPIIYPLIHECYSHDVVIVQVNPMNRDEVPTTSRDILNRINELSFNSSLVREMRGIATISKLIEDGAVAANGAKYARVNFHLISAEAEMAKLGALSKFNADWRFLSDLRALGFETADRWLATNHDRIGVESTVDVFDTFM